MSETTRPAGSAPVPAAVDTDIRTFLFVDARGYTRFTHERGDEAAAHLARRFAEIADEVVSGRGGRVVELRGDEVLAVFRSARQALHAAVDLQRRFAAERTADPNLMLPVGIGLDAGEAVPLGGGYRGGALNLAARLCSMARAGEVLASATVTHLARKVEGIEYVERGPVPIKGLTDPVSVVEIRAEPSPSARQDSGKGGDARAIEPSAATGERDGKSDLPIAGFLGALPEGEMVAREAELRQLLDAAAAVEAGAGRFFLLAGEPGIGKTRLGQEAMVHLLQRGFILAAGRCYESRTAVPFYPFLDMLNALVAGAPEEVRAQTVQRRPYLAMLVPDLPIEPPAVPGGIEEQERLFRAVAGFITALAKTAPVALLLDDLHWADASSLDLLHYLVRETRASRVLVVGAYRDVEVDAGHPLQHALAVMMREQLVERVVLPPLDPTGTGALVAVTLGRAGVAAELTDLVFRSTEGNAFFIRELLQAWIADGSVYRHDDRWERRGEAITVPDSVRAIIGQRIRHLTVPAQELLHEASVLGQTFAFDDLAAMGRRNVEENERALEESVAAGLVREGERQNYVFAHALIQQALYADLSRPRQQRLHRRAGEVLERLPERVREGREAEIADHLLAGGDRARAPRLVLLAGDRAEAFFAHRDAEQRYATALQLAEELDDRQIEVEAREKLGGVLTTMARHDEALTMLERAADLYRVAGDLAGEGRVTAQIGFVHHRRGTPREGIARLQSLLQSLAPPGTTTPASPVVFSLYLALTNLLMLHSEYGEGLVTAERLAGLARDLNDPRLLAQAEIFRGDALWVLGRQEDGLRVVQHALPLAEAVGDIDTLALGLDVQGDILLVRGELPAARQSRERALELFQRLGDPAKVTYGTASLGWVIFYLGEWPHARRQFERATDLAQALGSSRVAAYPLIGLAMCDLAEGNIETAARYLEESVGICEATGSPEPLTYAQELLAERDLITGDPDAARMRLERFLDHRGIAEGHVPTLLATLAEAYIALDNLGRADEVLDKARSLAVKGNSRMALIGILRVQGVLRARQERWDETDRSLTEARWMAHAMAYPYAEARALHAHGQALASAGNRQAARRHLEDALAIFRRLGAREWTTGTLRAIALLDCGSPLRANH